MGRPHDGSSMVAMSANGLPALQYLSPYLYCGTINQRNIVRNDGTHVTFRYREGKSGTYKTRRVTGEYRRRNQFRIFSMEE
ncbi:MAG: hypothetical protein HOI95_03520 [Chromatiales bacterium]|nr:hypothetical protein [Chromatiales bacterium]